MWLRNVSEVFIKQWYRPYSIEKLFQRVVFVGRMNSFGFKARAHQNGFDAQYLLERGNCKCKKCIFGKRLDMRAFKFDTRISKDGTIQIPFTPSLFNTEVEIIIVPKEEKKRVKKAGRKFVEQWAGFLNSNDTDSSKFDYLSEKYK